MMVNRVFCYSKNVAKQNGNRLPILELILITVLGMVAFISLVVTMKNNFNITLLVLFFVIWIILIIYYSAILGLRLRNRVTGYATDVDGRIFKVMNLNNAQNLYFGGVATGGMIDHLTGNNSNLGKNLGGVVGATAQFYSISRSAKYMSHPEIIAKIVESSPNITSAEVMEILKVYSITNRKRNIKVNCDYKNLRNNKIKYNKNLVIEKSFNMLDDLVSIIDTHK